MPKMTNVRRVRVDGAGNPVSDEESRKADRILWRGTCPKCGNSVGLRDDQLEGKFPVMCHSDDCGFSETADYLTLLNLRTKI